MATEPVPKTAHLAEPLPLSVVRSTIIRPMWDFLPRAMNSPGAEVMLLAIGGQESGFQHRRQIGGPARGFGQFEQGGGVRGVLRHISTAAHAREVCRFRNVNPNQAEVYNALEHDDILALAFMRLLLYSDPAKLPAIGDEDAAWALYARTWRPGKPHRERWGPNYRAAVDAVRGPVTGGGV